VPDEQPEVDRLISLLLTDDYNTAQSAGEALTNLGSSAIPELLQIVRGVHPNQPSKPTQTSPRSHAAGILADIGEPAVLPLLDLLSDPDEHTRWPAVDALGRIGDPRALGPLLKTLKDPSEFVRVSAPWALKSFVDNDVVEALLDALNDPYWEVRQGATYVLRHVVTDRLSKNEQSEDRVDETLAKRVLSALGNMLNDDDPFVRAVTVYTLGEVGNEEVIPTLKWIAENDTAEDEWGNRVSVGAGHAIESIQKRLER
jgi:HEAT repeat protein